MKRKFLITGGAGFIGSNFVHYILEQHDDAVLVLDKLTYAGNLENLSRWEGDSRYNFIRGDVADRALLKALFDNQDFTHVVHFAAESHVDRSISGPEDFIRTNITGTFNLLEEIRGRKWAADSGKRFLHISTDEVYGSLGPEGYFTEESPYRPNSPYSASKAGSDLLVRSYFHTFGLPVIISNCTNNYGPYQFPEKLIPLMLVNCVVGKTLPVYGEGTNVRDWIHVRDHCRALEMILNSGRVGESYLAGGNNEMRNIEIVHLICDIMDERYRGNAPHRNLIEFVQDRPGHDFRYAVSTEKIHRELGWQPQYSFDEGIRATVDWYLINEQWWRNIMSGEYEEYYKKQYT